MKEENKHCYNCMYFGRFYTKGYNSFTKSKWGLCKSKQVKEMHEICGGWTCKNEFNRSVKKEFSVSASLKVIEEMMKNLTEIGQILRELQDNDV